MNQPVIALAGRPNTGKTTLFNALTGRRQRVANFAGCTVEKAVGAFEIGSQAYEVVDLPGTFSILAETPDEQVAFDFLSETAASGRPLRLLCVAEASNLTNDLALALSLKACGYSVALVVNMIDEAELNGLKIDAARLASEAVMPVALVSARYGRGLERLDALLQSRDTAGPPLDLRDAPRATLRQIHRQAQAAARKACAAAVTGAGVGRLNTIARSIKLDKKLFHPVAGPLILAVVMFLVFQSLFTWARPVMDAISAGLTAFSTGLRPLIASPLLASFVCDGAIAGLSAVAVFVPQIALLFTLIGFLEQSGYLPRAGAMVDRALRPFGLDGKVFIPFLSSFACAIPGIMATRTIQNEKRRLTALLLCPLMTCSARIPVYTLIIAAFVPPSFRPWGLSGQGLVMAGMYVFGVVLALLLALALRATSLYEANPSPVTVLPPYRLPMPRELGRYVWSRVWQFLSRAGRVIFALSIVLWLLSCFPRAPLGASPSFQLEQSLLGRLGKTVEPVFAPIGYDWRLSVAVISSLAAREVFVGTLGTLFALGAEAGASDDLISALRRDPRYGLATAVSLLLFFAVALQCVSTVAVVRRETGGWKWPAIQFASFFALAYGLSWAGYHLTKTFLG